MQRTKRSGASTDPGGTPNATGRFSEFAPLSNTSCYYLLTVYIGRVFLRRCWWSTVLKSLAMSKYEISVYLPKSRFWLIWWNTKKSWLAQDLPLTKPCSATWMFSRWGNKRLHVHRSTTFTTTGIKEKLLCNFPQSFVSIFVQGSNVSQFPLRWKDGIL